MRIVLLRHGEPEISLSKMLRNKCSAAELKALINIYNGSGINTNHAPPSEAHRVTRTCRSIACSDLPRSIESAKALAVPKIDLMDSVFRESDLPHANWRYPKIPLYAWLFFFRALWFLGYSNNGEPISTARQRAGFAYLKLRQMAVENGSVMLIGHGIVNRLVAKILRSHGWNGPGNPGNNYWEYGIYDFFGH